MRPDEARDWLSATVPRETIVRLEAYVDLLQAESQNQNLIARSTIDAIWSRHIVDSGQLWALAEPSGGLWLDVGSGAGLPGIVLAVLGALPMTLVEPRALRARFLVRVVTQLGLHKAVTVVGSKVAKVALPAPVSVITARAVAPLADLFAGAHHLTGSSTTWLLLKGRTAAAELEAARQSWQGEFALKPSITDPEAAIVIARNVRPRSRR